jgi:hypothetical protein
MNSIMNPLINPDREEKEAAEVCVDGYLDGKAYRFSWIQAPEAPVYITIPIQLPIHCFLT